MVASILGSAMVVLLMVLAAVLIVAALVAGVVFGIRYIRAQNQQTAALAGPSIIREQRLSELTTLCSQADLREEVERLAETARFSDWSIVLPSDEELDASIGQLKEALSGEDVEECRGAVARVKAEFQRRQVACEAAKRGSF